MRSIRRRIVVGLEWACGWLDCIPTLNRCHEPHACHGSHCAYTRFGCGMLRLATKSMILDDRWQTAWLDRKGGNASVAST
jgi:hypothetical protein